MEHALRLLLATTLSLLSVYVLAQESGKSSPGALAEFNTAIATVIKISVTINFKGKRTESFCKRSDALSDTEIKKLQLSCEKIFNDTALPEIQRFAAKYILGKTKTQYNVPDHAIRNCDEALPLLSSVADFYDQKNILGNGPYEAIASCLISIERHEPALVWIERGIKRKETAQMQYLAGVARQALNEFILAKNAFERALALDANYEAAKKSLAQIESLPEQPGARPEQISIINSNECRAWTEAIISNRTVCDALLEKSFDEFFSCMDVGMTTSGYGPRSDEQTQQFYQNCGLSSWTDESLKPQASPENK